MSITRSSVEARIYRELFLERLNIVADGSVYTKERMTELFGCKETMVEEFVRLCLVHPSVDMQVKRSRGQPAQYTFRKVQLQEAGRVIELARSIVDDSHTSSRSLEAAKQIIATLGG